MRNATMEPPAQAPAKTKYKANRFGRYDCPFCDKHGESGFTSTASLAQHARHAHGRGGVLNDVQKAALVDANQGGTRPVPMPPPLLPADRERDEAADLGEGTGFTNPLRREFVSPGPANGRHYEAPAPAPARKPSRMEAAVQIMQLDAIRGMTRKELASVFEAVANLAAEDDAQATEGQPA